MAEISYPFEADNVDGGTALVSQTQWQDMTKGLSGDYVDFPLTAGSYSSGGLPFYGSVVNGRDVVVKPGKAWVGGFYYSLTADKTLTIESNSLARDRKDLIVIRVDMAKSAVNLVVLKGTSNLATPVPPVLRREPGGIWEMPLYEVHVGGQDSSIVLSSRYTFREPGRTVVPWNAVPSAALTPKGSFVIDMDSNGGGLGVNEYFNAPKGVVPSRTLGTTNTYTPSLTFSSISSANRKGRWRRISPNMVWFSVLISNTANVDYKGSSTLGISLPVTAESATGQVVPGFLENPALAAGVPNMTSLTGRITTGSTGNTFYVYYPAPHNLAQGLDGLVVIPRKSKLTISGVIEIA